MPRSMIAASSSGSMLPPESTRPTFLPAKRAGCRSSAASAGRAGAFDQRLLDLEQHQHRLLDVAFVDQQQVVDVRRR